ncbi:MAG: hypothetical protein ABL904_15040 [Hyphomicrobiaceae bacterium]
MQLTEFLMPLPIFAENPMRFLLAAMLLLVASVEVSLAQAQAAKPAASWILKWFQGTARTTSSIPKAITRTTKPAVTQKSVAAAAPPKAGSPVEAAEKNSDSVFSTGRTELGKHNAKQTAKCVLKDKRLPDGLIIKYCAEKEKPKR